VNPILRFVSAPRGALLLALIALGGHAAPAAGQSPSTDAAFADALREALRRSNPEIAAGRAAVRAAEARARAAGFPPPLALTAEAEEIPDGVNLPAAGSVRVGVEGELLSRGRREAVRALAATDVRAATAALDLTEQRLVAEGTRAIVRVNGGSRVAQRLAAEDSLLLGVEAALRARFSVGEARYVDVLRLRTERLRIQSERAEAVTEAVVGRRTLEALLSPTGTTPADTLVDRLLRAAPDALLAAAIPPAPDLDSLVTRSAAVQLAAAAVERARAARTLLAAELRPRLSGGVGLQKFEGEGGGAVFGPTLGASLSLPSTARGANRAALAAAEAEIAAAEAERAATLATLRRTLVAARERYEAARTRLSLFDAALLRGARQEREAALAGYGAGDLSLIELLDFERALARAEIEGVRARIEAADALAELLSADAGETGREASTLRPSRNDER
jgi:outer membrane protein TolC